MGQTAQGGYGLAETRFTNPKWGFGFVIKKGGFRRFRYAHSTRKYCVNSY